jgi:hypothetical protein
MTYFADLTPHTYTRFDAQFLPTTPPINVGWLDKRFPFPTGTTSDEFRVRLAVLCESHLVHLHRGSHGCEFCTEDKLYTPTFDPTYGPGRRLVRAAHGNGTICVTHDGVSYAAPALIIHYVREHNYLPPEAFVQAVLDGVVYDDAEERADQHARSEKWLQEFQAKRAARPIQNDSFLGTVTGIEDH